MLRIERSGNGQVLFTLSGRIEEGEIQELQQLLVLEKSGRQLIFNLRDVTLVNQDAVKFLAQCKHVASSSKIVRSTSERGSIK
jgi:anti-anti-sigma regulatory factor